MSAHTTDKMSAELPSTTSDWTSPSGLTKIASLGHPAAIPNSQRWWKSGPRLSCSTLYKMYATCFALSTGHGLDWISAIVDWLPDHRLCNLSH